MEAMGIGGTIGGLRKRPSSAESRPDSGLEAWRHAEAELAAERRTFADRRQEALEAIRPALQPDEGDPIALLGRHPWFRRPCSLVLTGRRVFMTRSWLGAQSARTTEWPRDAVRAAALVERDNSLELELRRGRRSFRVAVPYHERGSICAVADALGGYPVGRRSSLFWLWALCPVIDPIAWLHAAIVTRRLIYGLLAVAYTIPVVIGALVESGHAHSSAAGGWYAISWGLCLMHALWFRDWVAQQMWDRSGRRRTSDQRVTTDADGRIGRLENFEDTVSDQLPAGEWLVASLPQVSLPTAFRHDLDLDLGIGEPALALTNRRVLVTRVLVTPILRRRFSIVADWPRSEIHIGGFRPAEASGDKPGELVIEGRGVRLACGFVPALSSRARELISELGGVIPTERDKVAADG